MPEKAVLAAPPREPRREPRFALRSFWPALAALAVLGALSGYFLWLRPAKIPAGTRVMLVVLPFENLTGDSERDFFSDGFTEEMITSLGTYQPAQLGVIARTSAMRYKGAKKSIAEIGRELGVDFVLEGSVRRESNRVRITAQLIRVQDQTHLWARSYDRELRDILPLQSEVAGDIAREIRVTLTPRASAQNQSPQQINPDAYEAYLRGLFFWQKRNKENLEKSIEQFREALRREPAFAMAYAGLARSQTAYTGQGYAATAAGAAEVEQAASRALALNPNLGEAYAALGWVYLTRWEWTKAEQTYQRAIALNPNDSTAHLWYGYYLLRTGRYQESLLERQRAHDLDPLDLTVNSALARNLYQVGRTKEALLQLQKTQVLDPQFAPMGWYYLQEKDYAQAKGALEQAARACRRCPRALAQLGHVYALSGDRKQAAATLQELKQRAQREFVSPYHLAVVHAGLGELNQAFDALERAFQARDFLLFSLREDAYLMPLQGDARYQGLLRRMNFPGSSAN